MSFGETSPYVITSTDPLRRKKNKGASAKRVRRARSVCRCWVRTLQNLLYRSQSTKSPNQYKSSLLSCLEPPSPNLFSRQPYPRYLPGSLLPILIVKGAGALPAVPATSDRELRVLSPFSLDGERRRLSVRACGVSVVDRDIQSYGPFPRTRCMYHLDSF